MLLEGTQLQQQFPDVWYDPNTLAIAGTASWVVAGLVIAYFVLRWMKNTEKFYAALGKQGSEVRR